MSVFILRKPSIDRYDCSVLISCQSRVLITAVDCRNTRLELKFFNNCFFDDYSDGNVNVLVSIHQYKSLLFLVDNQGSNTYTAALGGMSQPHPLCVRGIREKEMWLNLHRVRDVHVYVTQFSA